MSLLSREERRELDDPARRNLRRKRRASRTDRTRDGNRPKVLFNGQTLEDLARELIADVAADSIPGEEKMLEVLDDLADLADGFISWGFLGVGAPVAEAMDGPVIRAIVHTFLAPTIQQIYEKMTAEGLLGVIDD